MSPCVSIFICDGLQKANKKSWLKSQQLLYAQITDVIRHVLKRIISHFHFRHISILQSNVIVKGIVSDMSQSALFVEVAMIKKCSVAL